MADETARIAAERSVIDAARDYVHALKTMRASTPIYAIQDRLVTAVENLDTPSCPAGKSDPAPDGERDA